jgi:hypothetical protein
VSMVLNLAARSRTSSRRVAIWVSSSGHAASDRSPTVHGSTSLTSLEGRPISSSDRIVSTIATAFGAYVRYPFDCRSDDNSPCCS